MFIPLLGAYSEFNVPVKFNLSLGFRTRYPLCLSMQLIIRA
jgi:hypothetical protein